MGIGDKTVRAWAFLIAISAVFMGLIELSIIKVPLEVFSVGIVMLLLVVTAILEVFMEGKFELNQGTLITTIIVGMGSIFAVSSLLNMVVPEVLRPARGITFMLLAVIVVYETFIEK